MLKKNMKKILLVSFSRSSNEALSKLKKNMADLDMLTDNLEAADYLLAVGDRKETFDFVLPQWEQGKKIIHLWAGDNDTNTNDDVYRHSMTLMSEIQLCTNPEAKKVVEDLCEATGKKPNSYVVGNVMLDNLEVDESLVPKEAYDLFLENPGNPQIVLKDKTKLLPSLPRPQFLGLLRNCRKFITNSSCEY